MRIGRPLRSFQKLVSIQIDKAERYAGMRPSCLACLYVRGSERADDTSLDLTQLGTGDCRELVRSNGFFENYHPVNASLRGGAFQDRALKATCRGVLAEETHRLAGSNISDKRARDWARLHQECFVSPWRLAKWPGGSRETQIATFLSQDAHLITHNAGGETFSCAEFEW